MTDMTFETTGPFDTPDHSPSSSFEFLSEDSLTLIEEVRQRILEAKEDRHTITAAVESLNNEFIEMGLIGSTGRLRSDFTTVTSSSLLAGDQDVQLVVDDESLLASSFEGTMMGCEALIFEHGTELVYRLELPIDETSLRYKTVTAPVDMASLQIDRTTLVLIESEDDGEESEEDEEQQGYIYEILKTLQSIENDEVQKALIQLKACYEATPSFDVSFFRQFAVIANHLLTYPEVRKSEEATSAIEELFIAATENNYMYAIEGYGAVGAEAKGKIRIKLLNAKVTGKIQGVGLYRNFEVDEARKKLDILNSNQVVFIVIDKDNKEHIIPIQFLTKIDLTDQATPKKVYCESARDRFMLLNPGIFSKK